MNRPVSPIPGPLSTPGPARPQPFPPVVIDQEHQPDTVSIRPSPRSVKRAENSERHNLLLGQGLTKATQLGIKQAIQVLDQVISAWQQPQGPSEEQLASWGGELLTISQHTGFRSLSTLRSEGMLSLPQASVPSYRLFGSEPEALVGLPGLLPNSDPQEALASLTTSKARLMMAQHQLRNNMEQFDRLHLQLNRQEESSHNHDLDTQRLRSLKLAGLEQLHFSPDRERMVELLVPALTDSLR